MSSLPTNNSQIYEVTRGMKFNGESFIRRINDIELSVQIEDAIKIAEEIEKDCRGNFGGSYHSNSFRVNKGIFLTGVGFFGPALVKESNYFISMEVFEAKKNRLPDLSSRRIAISKEMTRGKRGEIFIVNFKRPVYIQPGVWNKIEFCLEGPDTLKTEKNFREGKVPTTAGLIHFDFLNGSRQMPILQFRI